MRLTVRFTKASGIADQTITVPAGYSARDIVETAIRNGAPVAGWSVA